MFLGVRIFGGFFERGFMMFLKRCKSLMWGEMVSVLEVGFWCFFFGLR